MATLRIGKPIETYTRWTLQREVKHVTLHGRRLRTSGVPARRRPCSRSGARSSLHAVAELFDGWVELTVLVFLEAPGVLTERHATSMRVLPWESRSDGHGKVLAPTDDAGFTAFGAHFTRCMGGAN